MSARTLILGTAGHIDHGKTALIRALTGIDTDRLPQEKQRGITIDVGFANLDLGDVQLGIVDVPGHERFVKNMLAGAVGVDVALLVVAADDSIMPQTREHLAILRLLGVEKGLVALTKCDRVEDDWIELVEDDIRRLVAGSFLADAPIVRTTVPPEGEPAGLDALREAIGAVSRQVVEGARRDVFRMPIDRVFTVEGRGTVVTGTVWSGELHVKHEVQWQPHGTLLQVRGLENHGHETELVERGQRAAINLAGVHHRDVERGNEIATPGYLAPSKLLSVELHVLPDSPRPVKHRSRQRLHLGTQEVMAVVALLDAGTLAPGQRGLAQLHCAQPTTGIAGQPFVVRAESPLATIGGGRVLQPRAARITRRGQERIERLPALLSADELERAAAAIYFYGTDEWTTLDLCRDAQLDEPRASDVIEQLSAVGTIVELAVKPRRLCRLHRDVFQAAEQRLLQIVDKLHSEAALRTSVARDRLVAAFGPSSDAAVAEAVIDRLLAAGTLTGDHQHVALAGYVPRLSAAELRLRQQALEALNAAGLKPPTAAELARTCGADENRVRQILALCSEAGEIVALDGELYLHADVEAALRATLQEPLGRDGGMTVSQIKDALGTTRKFAVPICEYLDRVGFTRREGDVRVLA